MKPLLLALLVVLAASCGGAPPMQPLEATPPVAPAPASAPAARRNLAEAMPANVLAFATMPGTKGLSDVVAQVVQGADLLDLVGKEVQSATSVSGAAVTGFLRDLDGVAVAITAERELLVAMHASDPGAVDRLLDDEAGFQPAGSGEGVQRYTVVSDDEGIAKLQLHWHRDRQILLLGEEGALAEGARSLGGETSLSDAQAFHEAATRFAPDPAINLYVGLPALVELAATELPFVALSPLVLSLTLGEGVELRATATIGGDDLPAAASYARPAPFELPATLPGDTIAFLAYSSRIGGAPERKGPVLLQALKALDPGAARGLQLGAKAFGIDVQQALNALGDEGVVGFVLPPAGKLERKDLLWEGALLLMRQRLRDRTTAGTILDRARDALSSSGKVRVKPLRDGFFVVNDDEEAGAAIALRGEELVVTFGHKAGAKALLDAGAPTLGDDGAYRRLEPRFAGEHVGLWLDLQRGLEALGRNVPVETDELLSLARTSGERPIGGLSFGWQPEDDGWRVHATMHDVATLGVVSALMVHGVRRYLTASKTSEAKMTVAAITRGARAFYERQAALGAPSDPRLCASAEPVPARVPSGQKYLPSQRPGEDYLTGDDGRGWTCLKFNLTMPHYYRYTYRQGSGYVGPARGGPDPGPNGFEAAAEGDLDGDGDTSLFTMTGRVDPETGELIVASELFVDAEFE